jgi:CRP/FNR family transcriptional regulator, cyclic AMP receptor protein
MNRLTLIEKAFWLKKQPLFAALELDMLLPIADKIGTIHLKANNPIFYAKEEPLRLYFILTGAISIIEGPNTHALLGPGDFFGDEAIFGDAPYAYDAICKDETTLLTLSRTHLFTIIHECPSVAVALLQAYASGTSYRRRIISDRKN